MKKLLSFLLALSLLLALAGCGAESAPTAQQPVTEATAPEGTTLPLYWPPLPEETEATEAEELESLPPDQTQPTEDTRPREEGDSGRPSPNTGSNPSAGYTPQETQGTSGAPQTDYEPRPDDDPVVPQQTQPSGNYLDPNGSYDSKKDVALFIHTYGYLPNNYITKRQAEALGWSGGSVERYAPGKCIGGDRFYNNEGLLPRGHTYYECDIGTLGKSSRGAQRIVYSTDGLIYYTSNHYKSFTLLYGNP